jgi:hypothetical protein
MGVRLSGSFAGTPVFQIMESYFAIEQLQNNRARLVRRKSSFNQFYNFRFFHIGMSTTVLVCKKNAAARYIFAATAAGRIFIDTDKKDEAETSSSIPQKLLSLT